MQTNGALSFAMWAGDTGIAEISYLLHYLSKDAS